MGVLQDFERRLEGAVEGFFARAFRAGLQPVELAKALQRYAADTQHVTSDGVVVPNVYRFTVSPKDAERLSTFGDALRAELAEVVVRTAEERRWRLRGPAVVRLETSDEVDYGRYELRGRVEAISGDAAPAAAAAPRTSAPAAAASPAAAAPPAGATTVQPAVEAIPKVKVVSGGQARSVRLVGERMVAGRVGTHAIPLSDTTVSRDHAAFVLRDGAWWVVDLGSTNGTKVNGTRTTEQQLAHGDRVELGEAVLQYTER
ncbi:MAG: FhaA domain-containing protein [Actinomycetes bacterium]